jgi:DNA invertase Pin-like site-specific DNA recombinase
MNTQNLTILYERLSRDDGEDSVSNSIKNQQGILQEYAERNGLVPYRHEFDDGYSGTGWNRPGWQRVIEEIEAGRVKNLVVKNLDRMGRDYLRVGLYMEMFR